MHELPLGKILLTPLKKHDCLTAISWIACHSEAACAEKRLFCTKTHCNVGKSISSCSEVTAIELMSYKWNFKQLDCMLG